MTPPPRLGTPSQFAALREYLSSSGYSEDAVCRELGIEHISEFDAAPEQSRPGLLTSLFICGREVPSAALEGASVLFDLGLVVESGGNVSATVALYPVCGVYIASDRIFETGGSPAPITGDFVFAAITPNSLHFIEMLPWTPCDAFLDIGCGAGLAAILASRCAHHVWATDIAERSCEFTRFNCALNGIESVTVRAGSLFEPVEGETFDRIVAHLPFFPTLAGIGVYVDGGDDGEQVTRGVIKGLEPHLRPGGRFYALTMVSDRESAAAEERIREWLGTNGDDFDVILAVRALTDPRRFALESVFAKDADVQGAQQYAARFQRLEITQFVYTHIVIARHASKREGFTARRDMTTLTRSADLEWLIDWEMNAGQMDLTRATPHLSPAAELSILHRVQDGQLTPVEYVFRVASPFQVEMECRGWMAVLASHANGTRTVAELFRMSQAKAGVSESQFTVALRALVSAGVFTLT